jgi:death-on-curing protein
MPAKRKVRRPHAKSSKPSRVREGQTEPHWVSRVMLDAIHDAQIREHGGSSGVRDEGLLESLLARARNKFAYAETDLATLAAAYAFGLAKNHGFVDANKRAAFQTAYLFLGLKGFELEAPEPEVVDVMNRVATSAMTEATLAAWIRAHMHPSR